MYFNSFSLNFEETNSQQEKFYDTHEQVGRSYANGRFKVLAQISEGCQPILNVKLFSRRRIPSEKAVGNKCSYKQGKADGKNCKYVSMYLFWP